MTIQQVKTKLQNITDEFNYKRNLEIFLEKLKNIQDFAFQYFQTTLIQKLRIDSISGYNKWFEHLKTSLLPKNKEKYDTVQQRQENTYYLLVFKLH